MAKKIKTGKGQMRRQADRYLRGVPQANQGRVAVTNGNNYNMTARDVNIYEADQDYESEFEAGYDEPAVKSHSVKLSESQSLVAVALAQESGMSISELIRNSLHLWSMFPGVQHKLMAYAQEIRRELEWRR